MIEIRSLTFGYGRSPLFDSLDLRLEGGRAYGLLGLNGAGKTSLLKLLAGALIPLSGKAEVFGRVPAKREAAHLADVAFVPEDPWLPSIPPSAWLARYAIFRPAFDRERFDELRREFVIGEQKALSKLSYGQRKKFALAAALASGARTILLDEPTNGLDIPSKMQFRKALVSALSEDRVIVVSTHQVRDLESLIDPILILDKGRLAIELDAEELSTTLASAHVSSLEGMQVVYAERDALGWSALVARRGGDGFSPAAAVSSAAVSSADLELVFNAALAEPSRLAAAVAGGELAPYVPAADMEGKE